MNFTIIISFLMLSTPYQGDEEVKQMLNQKLAAFESAMKSNDLEGVLDFFGPDGAYGQAKGRQEIARSLSSYLKNEIVAFTMQTSKITLTESLANHMGSFQQEYVMNGFRKKNDGKFRIIWYKYSDGWKIQYMSMEPDRSN